MPLLRPFNWSSITWLYPLNTFDVTFLTILPKLSITVNVAGASFVTIRSKEIFLVKGLINLLISACFPVRVTTLLNRSSESRVLKTTEQSFTITIIVAVAKNEQSGLARFAGVDPTTNLYWFIWCAASAKNEGTSCALYSYPPGTLAGDPVPDPATVHVAPLSVLLSKR